MMATGPQPVRVELLEIAPARVYVPPHDMHRLAIHVGPSVNADCHCDGRRHRRVQRDGDFDVIPAGLDGTWEDDRPCKILRILLPDDLLTRAAADVGLPVHGLRPQFQLRDPAVVSIAHLMRQEVDTRTSPDPHYLDALGRAIAVRLVGRDPPRPQEPLRHRRLSRRQHRLLADYVEAHLDRSLSLASLAALVAMSLSTFKLAFRQSFGIAPYQYLLSRRVERARMLVTTSTLSFPEIAVAAGFCHQSHMSNSMKRLLGHPPSVILRDAI